MATFPELTVDADEEKEIKSTLDLRVEYPDWWLSEMNTKIN